jgi:hypothetical protein
VNWDEILKHVNENEDEDAADDDVLMVDADGPIDATEEYDEEPTKCIVETLQV